MRQEDLKFKANLSYIARPCIKISKNLKIKKRKHMMSLLQKN
jgi:hypothetical protein